MSQITRQTFPLPPDPSSHAACLYVSSATPSLSLTDIDSLLAQARIRNERDGITGLLLFGGGNFMQYFEGPQQAVVGLRNRLQSDPRHYDIHYILQTQIEKPRFSQWTMGFLGTEMSKLRSQYSTLEHDDRLLAHLFELGGVLERIMHRFYREMR